MSLTKRVFLGAAAVALAALTIAGAVAASGEADCRQFCPKSGDCPPCCQDC